MKYIITGSLGHISKPLISPLVKAGHQVVVVTSNDQRVKEITNLGAVAAVGSVEDENFLVNTFQDADAAYLMIPTKEDAPDIRESQNKIALAYKNALAKSKIRYVVALSSIGAHVGDGTGPIDGISDFEKYLSELKEVNVKILRPSYFYYNLFSQVDLIKNLNIAGGNFGISDEKLVLTDTNDIADVVLEELLALNFKGQSIRYIASDERHPNEIAEVLSKAVGKENVLWVSFTDDQSLNGMLQAGLPKGLAESYTEMGKAIREGIIQEDYWKNRPAKLGKVKLEDFAKEFAEVYKN